MYKKNLISAVVGIALLVSPFVTAAQSNSTDNSSIIATLQQLIVTLTQELQQLIAAHSSSSTTSSPIIANAENGYQGTFSVSRASGLSPLMVQFNNTIQTAGDMSIDYGDGSSCSTANPDGSESCSLFTHTYATPGMYTAILYRHLPTTELARLSITVTSSSSGSTSQCSTYSYLQKGGTDASTGGQVSRMQQFLGMSNVTGYYGAQTSIAYQNKCGNLGNAQPTSVQGMSKYSDSDFSFWYPSNWNVTSQPLSPNNITQFSGGIVEKILEVQNNQNPANAIFLSVVSTARTITISGHLDSPIYYFDSTVHAWMTYSTNYPSPIQVDVSINTMGGLHMFFTGVPFVPTVVPLSAQKFLVIDDPQAGPAGRTDPLTKTILATNSAVAIPVSTSQQIATIQAEANAYAGQ